jgi:Fusaric acid resistance protein family
VLAALTGVGSALTVAITPAFWVATAWPTGATAVIIVATARSLLASLEQPAIATSALVRSDATHVPDDRALGIEVGIKYWSEWQDSNLRLQRPERK